MPNALQQNCLTISIPFYRGQKYLRSAIESVLKQSCPNWILHVVSDCGPERATEELVLEYNDPRIRFTENPHRLGIGCNWNRCLDLADTDLVTLLHSDDELRTDYVKSMLEISLQYPEAAAFFSQAETIGPDGQKIFSLADYVKRFLWPLSNEPSVLYGRRAIEALCRGNFLMCPTACYRLSRLSSRRFRSDLQFVLDLEFYTRLLFAGEYFVLIPNRMYAYRRHNDSATVIATKSLKRFEEEYWLYEELAKQTEFRGWGRGFREAKQRLLLRMNAILHILQKIRKRDVKHIINLLEFTFK